MLNNKQSRNKSKNKYTLIIVPGDESNRTKSFVIGKLGMVSIVLVVFFIMFSITILILVYSPVGLLFNLTNIEIENKHTKQVTQIQEKLNSLINEIVALRQYNLQLREALGEKVNDTLQKESQTSKLLVESLNRTNDTSVEIQSFQTDFENQIKSNVKSIQTSSIITDIEFPLTIPVEGLITREFNLDEGHLGIDIVAKLGSIVFAPAPGTVIFSNWTYNYGHTLIIAHSSGYRTVYKHNRQLLKSEGELVNRGDPIAIIGNTGSESTGPHLHFEIWKDAKPLNPKKFILNINN